KHTIRGVIAMLPPYVGILVNDVMYAGIPLGKTKYERIDYYLEAGKKFGITPCFFRIRDYKAGKAWIKAYVQTDDDKFELAVVPMPQVIHNRAIYNGIKEFRTLRSWSDEGRVLFNSWNRYGKLFIHNVLMKNPGLQPYLPRTRKATPANVKSMMKQFDSIIIKPDRSSKGRGVMKLSRTQKKWKLLYPSTLHVRNTKWHSIVFNGLKLPPVLRRRLQNGKYIVQQCVALATYKKRPFDLRVAVQRGAAGEWKITGIVAKVASDRIFLTNVSQGSTIHRLEEILQQEYPHLTHEEVIRSIHHLALSVADQLGQSLPCMADLGLDIGLTTDGVPMFIECNGKDQRYSFLNAGMLKEWKASYENPMAFAKHLLTSGKEVDRPHAGKADR
ncbi:YheC/YheD family protein, partial [Paenibacillus naphthalenovorans]|uniref:YheC/YheD family endospore coat-associated protein n=1 Tax=Paenibacillus naphthalenovorans TaxID=162209 RepID=UPI003D2B1FAD